MLRRKKPVNVLTCQSDLDLRRYSEFRGSSPRVHYLILNGSAVSKRHPQKPEAVVLLPSARDRDSLRFVSIIFLDSSIGDSGGCVLIIFADVDSSFYLT